MITSRRRLTSVCLALLVGVPALLSTSPAHAAETPDCNSFNRDLRQLVKPSTGTNLLTRWDAEAALAQQRYGYTSDLGVLADVAPSDGPALNAVWRLYKGGDFVWATEGGDADSFVSDGYVRQSVDFYGSSTGASCLSAVYRFERGSVHRMATGDQTDALVNGGWTRQAIVFYAKTGDDTTPAEPAPQPAQGDSKFSIAVVPDTQNESNSASDPRFSDRANWLIQNKADLDLRYAIQVGDLVNWGNVAPQQFSNMSTKLKPLEAAMPWAGAIGNHDTAAVCLGGSSCPGAVASQTVRDTSAYNAAFPVSRFPNLKGTFEPGKIDNSYQTFGAGGADWMILSLELWPRATAVDWAKGVVATHPNHNVIVVTHAYLEADGSISESNGGYGAKSPRYLYDNLVKLYPNIKMVLSGHVGDAADRTDTGVNGNKILSFMQTYHSATNPVRLVEIDTAAGAVSSRVYAPYTSTTYPGDSTATTGLNFIR